jgi:predicted Fe-S protein YdhL (DUF1289 family)
MSNAALPVPSPCVRNCCLDDDSICLGCFRSMEEIMEWGRVAVGDDRRRVILENARRRREAQEALQRTSTFVP